MGSNTDEPQAHPPTQLDLMQRQIDTLLTGQLHLLEALQRLVLAIAKDDDSDQPERTLDGDDSGGERDQSQPL